MTIDFKSLNYELIERKNEVFYRNITVDLKYSERIDLEPLVRAWSVSGLTWVFLALISAFLIGIKSVKTSVKKLLG